MGAWLWEIFVCFLESSLVLYLLYKKIGLKQRKKWRFFAAVALSTAALGLLTLLDPSTIRRMILMWLFYALISFCFFDCTKRRDWYKAILWPSVCLFVSTIADNLTFSIAGAMVDYPLEELLNFGGARYQFTLIYLLLVGVMIWGITHVGGTDEALPLPVSIALFVLSVIGIVASESIVEIALALSVDPAAAAQAGKLSVLSYIILLILFALLATFEMLGVTLRKNRELEQERQLAHLEQRQYEMMVSATESLTEWKHDYQGQLRLIAALVKDKKYGELEQFAENLNSALPASAGLQLSGNRTMDAVVSLRMMDAKRHGIRFDTKLFLPEKLPLGDVMLASLIGNLLDNAVEASKKLPPEKAAISFEVKPWKQMLYIFCSNHSDGVYRSGTEGRLLSTKKGEGHGIGVRRIREIVDQAGGTCQFIPEPENFSVRIILPMEAAER